MVGFSGFKTTIVESVLIIVSLTGPLLLVIVSQEYLSSGAADESFYRLIANIAVNGHYLAFDFAMLALGLGSLMFCYLLYQSKLVPRFLSVIGLIGYAALAASSGLGFFGLDMRMILYLPGAIFELLFPIWLIVKGFNENATYSGALDENTVV